MIGQMRRCMHCNRASVVIQSRPMGSMDLCTLDCLHICAYEREGGNVRDMGGTSMKCPCCAKEFKTFLQSAYGKICEDCRNDFGIRNSIEAQDMIEMLEEYGPASIESLKNRAKPVEGTVVRMPPKPQFSKEKLAELTRTMITYGTLTPLPDSLDKPTTYAIAKNGLFEVRDNDIARIVTQPKDVLGLTDELVPGVTLHVPRVPYEMLQQTVAFFRETCERMKGTSEALVQIWWNRADKAYQVHVPEQSVSGGSVNHRSEFDKDNERDAEGNAKWLHVMDIHSHGSSMSAFWSGTDDNDERKAPEGRMFGVIGKVTQPLPEWRWRMRTREGFIDLQVENVFSFEKDDTVPFTVTWGTIFGAAGDKDGISSDGRVRLLCPVDPFKDAKCPTEWHEKVKGHSYGGGGWGRGMGFTMGHNYGYGQKPANPMPMYIYIETADNLLEEFLVDAEGKEPPKSTGKKIQWKPRENVH